MSVVVKEFYATHEPLTRREMQIVHIVCAGHTSREEIAAMLNIELTTVKKHLERIYGKLFISSLAEMCLYAIRAGWCDEYGRIKED